MRRSIVPATLANALLFSLCIGAESAIALNIGELSLHSRLGEPLHATISLGNVGSLTDRQVAIGFGSEADYRRLGVEPDRGSAPIRLELKMDQAGKASVEVTTERGMNEPYIPLVLEVRWPDGRAIKEFNLLLDP